MARQNKASQEPASPPPERSVADYTVLARRYRPQTFSEIIGQEHVARALTNAILGNRVAHAYLFTGNRGVGKTSTARILAKALNCVKGPTPTPCGECESCRGIAEGTDIDVIELDGASNNSVDDIRDLRNNTQYRPSRSRYKIYIIDEVHMLGVSSQKSAFNALLKTLEEPPPHVKFIFATTELQKIPLTILSRCQRFDFGGIALPLIVEQLRAIVQQEGREADDEALERIARRSGGSLRDAQSLLDQLLAFGAERLTVEQVHQMLGIAQDDRIIALAEAILAHDPRQALLVFDEVGTSGLQMGELLDQLINYWRDLMVVRCGAENVDLSVPPRHREVLQRQAQSVSLDTLLAGLDILATARTQLKISAHGRTIVEMALVRMGRLDNLLSLAQLGQWLTQQRDASGRPATGGNGSTKAMPPEGAKKNALSPAPEAPAQLIPLSSETLPQVWAQTLATLTASGLVGNMLARELGNIALPAIAGPNTLVLSVPTVYNHLQEVLQDTDRLRKVEDALRKITGRAWTLRVESVAEPASAPPPEADNGRPAPPRRSSREEAEQLPLIKRAMDALGASIQRVDEGFGALPDVRRQPPPAAPAIGGPAVDEES
jgi:DNA polymerase-3 subunit gamma/tau